MKIAVVSDVHSNLEALTAVLAHADARGAEAVWCCGDIVGYGPDPLAVIAMLRARDVTAVAGNHDLAACGAMGTEDFNPIAAAAATWTARTLDDAARAYLAALPLTAVAGGCTLVHGTLRDPAWEYLLTAEQAADQLARQETPYSIVGHSHLQFIAEERPGGAAAMRRAFDGDTVELGPTRLVLNPGGAGQPRDGDPRAPYMLYDEDAATVTFHRVPYDFAATQRKIRDAGLPEWLAARLEQGR